jgi:hypothetical protein
VSPSERPGQQSEVPGPVTDARQRALIDRAVVVVNGDDRILAAWLGGSYASGQADAYSDVDLHCLVVDDSAGWFTDHWSETAATIAGPLVLASNLPGVIGGYALTSDWVHLDLIIHPASMLEPPDVEGVQPLYDPTKVIPAQAERSGATRQGDPYFPAAAVDLFFYFLGNLVVTFGRGELIVAHGGIVAVRSGLIDLMLAERGIRRTGGPNGSTHTWAPTSAHSWNPFLAPTSPETRSLKRSSSFRASSSGAVGPSRHAPGRPGPRIWRTPPSPTCKAIWASTFERHP